MAYVHRMVHLPVSIMVGNSAELDHAAEAVKARVISEASKHRRTGAFIGSIKIAKVLGRQGNGTLVTDRLIYSDDPAVLSIEYGHDAPDGTHVPGQLIFTRAFARTGW